MRGKVQVGSAKMKAVSVDEKKRNTKIQKTIYQNDMIWIAK
jgi:hypothetical protein